MLLDALIGFGGLAVVLLIGLVACLIAIHVLGTIITIIDKVIFNGSLFGNWFSNSTSSRNSSRNRNSSSTSTDEATIEEIIQELDKYEYIEVYCKHEYCTWTCTHTGNPHKTLAKVRSHIEETGHDDSNKYKYKYQ